jgi:1,4-alpha-glucan branching enzyme
LTPRTFDDAQAIADGDHSDPFGYLGMHKSADWLVVRAFLPGAASVHVLAAAGGKRVAELPRVHDAGVFAGPLPRRRSFAYRLEVVWGETTVVLDDPYRFGSLFGDLDEHLMAEGTHLQAYERLGAHPSMIDQVAGVCFGVWAPNAARVSVVGDFNTWDGRRHPMRLHHSLGVWEIFIPGIGPGALYKFEIKDRDGTVLPLKADPYALRCEQPPGTSSVVHELSAEPWSDAEWMEKRATTVDRSAPMAIYEVHLGSWRRHLEDGQRRLSYRELAQSLVPYVKDMGFTHIELLPITEHPFEGSWGYQPIAMFAPTSRMGSPDDFRDLVEACHQAEIGLILDWVPAHFITDAHGLGYFDGTHLYEHADPRLGRHREWDTLIYNYGRREVVNFLLCSALFWLDRYHIDGLRVDAVASMLYLDYSRKAGDWLPNRFGGNENLDAVDFLKRLNETAYARHPGIAMIAEESTAWPKVSGPTYAGGLGFGYKWNMGWMHDTLDYIARDPIARSFHHDQLTFGLVYAFSENFILPLSHDEVVYGKRSLLGKMPGDRWQKFANLRLYYTFMYGHPGKKLMFMGCEFAQEREWNHDSSLDWHLIGDPAHAGVQRLVRDLNHFYRATPALHERDCEASGFEWIDGGDSANSVISFIRRGADPADFVIVVCNFTPVVRHDYRIGAPASGPYREAFNSDSAAYGGSDAGNSGHVVAEAVPCHGRPWSLNLVLPPLAALVLQPASGPQKGK